MPPPESNRAPGQGGRGTLIALVWPFLLSAAVYLFWNTALVFPLKIFTVFLHELSHGLAAIGTGGAIDRIELTADEGGVCWTRGGSKFLVTSAGYLGSLAFGALFVVIGGRARPGVQRAVVAMVGLTVLGATFLWVRTGFGFLWGLLKAAALLGIALWLSAGISVFVLRLLGITSGLYAIWDIGSDLIVRSIPSSDANALAGMTGIPGVVWGVVWGAAAIVVMAQAVRVAIRRA
jgi:Peptidase M50B-like